MDIDSDKKYNDIHNDFGCIGSPNNIISSTAMFKACRPSMVEMKNLGIMKQD